MLDDREFSTLVDIAARMGRQEQLRLPIQEATPRRQGDRAEGQAAPIRPAGVRRVS